ncbi:acyltransferase [Virgibacillus halodenitrificans]|uniref:acyltransferase n=1 Tax=Virgibacillus halodenitrificans TaxID=1482 RepID=UPI001FB2D6A5|nr:acyltransferase [Virgibacillus halodenitrificans]MCJ0929720.1 acyltransferase [Virgibacillus halodenitrificans]
MSFYEKVKKYSFIITLLTKIIKIFPKLILNLIWSFFDSSESKIAILYRYIYISKYCKSIGENVFIGKYVNLKNIENLTLGSNISIHSFNYLDAYGGISIGDNVSIANHCTIISSDHTWEDPNLPIKYNEVLKKPIVIQEDVWVAAGCRILGDVIISNRTVIGAGAVVNKNLKANSLYVGVPARKIKNLNEGKSNE